METLHKSKGREALISPYNQSQKLRGSQEYLKTSVKKGDRGPKTQIQRSDQVNTRFHQNNQIIQSLKSKKDQWSDHSDVS